MDNENKHVRDIIALEGGSLISAYRLPDDLFSDAKVTVDIVFLKKDKNCKNSPAWTKTVKTCVSGYRLSLNEYYVANPHHIIGKLDVVDMYGRKGLTCKKDTQNCFEKLHGLIEKKSQATQGKIMTETLKESISALRQELDSLSQALIMTGQKFSDISQKVSYFETLL